MGSFRMLFSQTSKVAERDQKPAGRHIEVNLQLDVARQVAVVALLLFSPWPPQSYSAFLSKIDQNQMVSSRPKSRR